MAKIQTEVHFTAAEVAEALGITTKTIRNWLDRKNITPSGETESGRFEFSVYDVAVLAVTHPMVEFGIPTRRAAEIADEALKDSAAFRSALKSADWDNPDRFSVVLAWINVFKVDDNWKWVWARERLKDIPAFIELNLNLLVRSSFRRAGLLPASKVKS